MVPHRQVDDLAQGYFDDDGILVRKWLPCVDDVVGASMFQVLVPQNFRSQVLRVAHDKGGHFGMRKTYLHVLKHFFWPQVKRMWKHISRHAMCVS